MAGLDTLAFGNAYNSWTPQQRTAFNAVTPEQWQGLQSRANSVSPAYGLQGANQAIQNAQIGNYGALGSYMQPGQQAGNSASGIQWRNGRSCPTASL
jgi:hypothetical protein